MKMRIESCTVCGNHESTTVSTKYEKLEVDRLKYELRKCSNCSHIFTFFYADVELNKYYDEGDYTVRDTRKSIYYKIQALDNNKILNTLDRLSPGKELLDFGCGKGTFLSFAIRKGFVVAGVETSKPRADYAANTFNIAVNRDFYSKGQIFNRKFSIITIFHVLEHLENVKDLFKNLVNDNLKPDGIVVIEVPNFGSWQSRWAGKRWLHLDIPRHVNHFTADSLEKFVNDCGLKTIKKGTFSWYMGIIGMAQSLMSLLGYKGFLIGDLKFKKNKRLLLALGTVLPFAFALECLSCLFNSGGVLSYYLKYEHISD
ncbi:MAG TPA: class I SAM-dependent methyltransferase [Mucilaginibacter sp.]|nr:class I SAM-dependent methyltransferase [Mucilaginibacter sp.]